MRQEGDGLNGLAQSHLICQDAVQRLFVHQDQPVEADHLVHAQLEVGVQGGGLGLQLHTLGAARRQLLNQACWYQGIF